MWNAAERCLRLRRREMYAAERCLRTISISLELEGCGRWWRWGGKASVVPCNYALEYHIRTLVVVLVNVLVYTYIGRIGPARISARSTYLGGRDHWD